MLGFFYGLLHSMTTPKPGPTIPFIRTDRHSNVIVDIQVVPNAAKTQVDGLYGEQGAIALKVRLNAPPVDGKANEALLKWLAGQLGIPRRSLEVVRGQTSRRKQLSMSAEIAAKADWHQLTRHITCHPAAGATSNATK